MRQHLRKNMHVILKKGVGIDVPENYFPNDDPTQTTIEFMAFPYTFTLFQLVELLCVPRNAL